MTDTKDIRFVRVCARTEIADKQGKSFRVGTLELALFHVNGEFFAVRDLCSHEHAPLSAGWLVDGKVECPRHAAQFDLRTGEALTLPATEPIEVFAVKVEGEDILVGVPVTYLSV